MKTWKITQRLKKKAIDWLKPNINSERGLASRKINTISTNRIVFPCGMSRSGTTLLTTIMDSHSKIGMSYELLPPKIGSLKGMLEHLEHGLELSQGDFSACGQKIRELGLRNEGLFFVRCYRAGIDAEDTAEILEGFLKKQVGVQTIRERYELAWAVSRKGALKKNKGIYGFKINAPSFREALAFFPNCRMIYILRDPRDVVASHLGRNFDRTIEDICHAWNNYLTSFETLMNSNQEMSLLIRYEDLVRIPHDIISKLVSKLSLEMENKLFEFYRSEAGIHSYGHPNSENLKKDFFTTSIHRWEKELNAEQIQKIELLCKEKMSEYDYR